MNPFVASALALLLWTLPGLALARRAGVSPRSPLAWCGLGLALSAALSTGLAFVCLVAGLPAGAFRWVLLSAGILGGALLLVRRGAATGERSTIAPWEWTSLLALLAMGALQGGAVSFTTDAPDHLGTLREILASGRYFPTEAFHLDAGSLGLDPRKGLLHPVYAALSALAGVDVVDFWLALPMLTALFPFLGTALFLRAAGAGPRWTLGGAWLAVLTWSGGLGDGYVPFSSYPNQVGAALFWMASGQAIVLLRSPSRSTALLFAVVGFAAVAVHPMYLVFLALLGLLMAAYAALAARDRPTLLALTLGGAGLVALTAPYLGLRLTQYAPANPIHTELQGMLFLSKRWYLANPAQLWPYVGVAGLFGYLGVLVAFGKRARTNPAAFLLTAGALSIPLLTLNPLLVPPLQEKLTYLIFRTPWFFPPAVAAGMAWSACFASDHRAPRWLGAVALAAVLVPALLTAPAWFSRSHARDGALDALRQREAFATLDAAFPERSVLAADPVTGYVIPAFTSHRVVATLDQHTSPNDARAQERALRARDILSPRVPAHRAWDLCRNTAGVVVNTALKDGLATRYWTANAHDAVLRRDQLDGSGCFARAMESGGLVAWRPETACNDTAQTPPLPGGPSILRPVAPGKDGLALLTGAALQAQVTRGAPLPVEVSWLGLGDGNPAQVTAAVRLDALQLPGGTAWGGKLTRKVRERLERAAYRARFDWSPGEGRLVPDAWPAGWALTDTVEVPVPAYLKPGAYVVRVSWNRFPYVPNLALSDLLRNDDVYWGVPVDTVQVSAD